MGKVEDDEAIARLEAALYSGRKTSDNRGVDKGVWHRIKNQDTCPHDRNCEKDKVCL
ncbi:hypothetical protein DYY67_0958 [Candidatus Nitrosotalea sp. TS]|nr:hypothetical protein [Candidatus Nitrosotalea sp. TS]